MDTPTTAPLRFQLLGGLQIARGDLPVRGFVSAKAQALLVYLAVTGRPHRREALAGLLWGEHPDANARRSLRQVLHNLRRVIGADLELDGDTVALAGDATIRSDVADFQAALAGATADGQLRAALELYRGAFLAGFGPDGAPDFDAWVAAQREHLGRLAAGALHTLATRAGARRDWAAAIESLTRLLALEPWREEGHRQLMVALASGGQRDAALAQYRACRAILADELGAAPEPETVALYERIAAGGPPHAGMPTAAPSPLPSPPTPILGREAEQAQLAAFLADPACRLLTLIGPGGVGKTRLALAAAAAWREEHADGVCFVDISAVTDAELVAPAIAEALHLPQSAAGPLLRLLRGALGERPTLLVLDNFEQVIAAAPLATDLLAACPELTILATSRMPLRVRGEQEFPVRPLALPDGARRDDPRAIAASPAVALFAARARAVRPDFALTAENAPTIAAICAGLDGLPLALELAAARIKLLPPAALLAHLGDRLTLLSGGARDLPARQQTLRATIAWSEGLLDPDDRRLFRSLGAFAGGASVEAIAAICDPATEGAARPRTALLASLAALLDQSLLFQTEVHDRQAGTAVPRFALLATIREYALEQLGAGTGPTATRERHAAYFLDLAEEAGAALAGPEQVRWLGQLEREHDNLHAALDWYQHAAPFDPSAPAHGLRLAAALWPFWDALGHLDEGRHRLATALHLAEQSGTAGAHPALARARFGAGILAFRQGDYAAATALLRASLATHTALGNRAGRAAALAALGQIEMESGAYQAARALHLAAIDEATAAGSQPELARALNGRGAVEFCLADYPAAARDLLASLAIERDLGNRRGIAATLYRLARVRRDQGELATARALAEESLAIQRDLGNRWDLAYALNALGNVARDQGDLDGATGYLTECLALQRQIGDRQGAAYSRHQLGIIARRQGDLARALGLARESLAQFRALGHRRGVAYALLALAQVTRMQGQAGARHLLTESLTIQHDLGDKRGISAALAEYVAAVAAGDPAHAASILAAAATLRERGGIGPAPGGLGEDEQARRALRERLGPVAFAAAWARGESWSPDEAVGAVLSHAGAVPVDPDPSPR